MPDTHNVAPQATAHAPVGTVLGSESNRMFSEKPDHTGDCLAIYALTTNPKDKIVSVFFTDAEDRAAFPHKGDISYEDVHTIVAHPDAMSGVFAMHDRPMHVESWAWVEAILSRNGLNAHHTYHRALSRELADNLVWFYPDHVVAADLEDKPVFIRSSKAAVPENEWSRRLIALDFSFTTQYATVFFGDKSMTKVPFQEVIAEGSTGWLPDGLGEVDIAWLRDCRLRDDSIQKDKEEDQTFWNPDAPVALKAAIWERHKAAISTRDPEIPATLEGTTGVASQVSFTVDAKSPLARNPVGSPDWFADEDQMLALVHEWNMLVKPGLRIETADATARFLEAVFHDQFDAQIGKLSYAVVSIPDGNSESGDAEVLYVEPDMVTKRKGK